MLEPLVELVLYVVFEVVVGAAGHVLLWAVTFGRWKPFEGNDAAATAAGLASWVLVLAAVWAAFWR